MTRDDLEQIRQLIREEVHDRIDQRLRRIEKNQETMIGTLGELSDAYREQQEQLRNHERRIDELERGGRDYLMDLWIH